MIPAWLTPEIVDELKAKYPGRLTPIKTELGGVVLRTPTREAIINRFPAPPSAVDVRGSIKTDDGDIDKDLALALASIVYPDEATVKGYISKLPMISAFLAARAKVSAAGLKGELLGAPMDIPGLNLQQLESVGVKVYQILTDIEEGPTSLVVRTPNMDALRQWEANRAKQSAVVASEGLVLACLVYPSADFARQMFQQRPLLGVYTANRLFNWGLGAVEEFEGGL